MFNIVTVQKPAEQALRQDGLSLLLPADIAPTLQLPEPQWSHAWHALSPSWERLPPDAHLKDGGHYRRRRHACFVHDTASDQLTQTPHRAHWQPTDYNALHGGFERFVMQEPLTALLLDDERVIHETTPIFPADGQEPEDGVRDTLVLTYRAGGFQAP